MPLRILADHLDELLDRPPVLHDEGCISHADPELELARNDHERKPRLEHLDAELFRALRTVAEEHELGDRDEPLVAHGVVVVAEAEVLRELHRTLPRALDAQNLLTTAAREGHAMGVGVVPERVGADPQGPAQAVGVDFDAAEENRGKVRTSHG